MLHKLRSEMLFLKCSMKSLHKCKMSISSAATAVWGRQSGFYYDMHAWNLQYDYGVVVSILILVTPNICQHLTECKSSSRNEPTSENLQNVKHAMWQTVRQTYFPAHVYGHTKTAGCTKDHHQHSGLYTVTGRTVHILITTVPNMGLVRNQYNIHQGYTKFPKI